MAAVLAPALCANEVLCMHLTFQLALISPVVQPGILRQEDLKEEKPAFGGQGRYRLVAVCLARVCPGMKMNSCFHASKRKEMRTL